MNYNISIEYSPIYELIISLIAYKDKKFQKNMDLGKEWMKQTKERLTAKLAKDIDDCKLEHIHLLFPLVPHSPDKNSIIKFLYWTKNLGFEELSNYLGVHVDELPVNAREIIKQYSTMLTLWNQQYFSKVDLRILMELSKNAEEKKILSTKLSNDDLFEDVTNGMRQSFDQSIKVVHLIPQHHLSPINSTYYYKDMVICFYSCDIPTQDEGHPPIQLMRITRCLSDETRMKILHLLSEEQRTFGELVKLTGLAKSTVHHHLIALRGAGLIRLVVSSKNNIYSFRREGINQLNIKLSDFLSL